MPLTCDGPDDRSERGRRKGQVKRILPRPRPVLVWYVVPPLHALGEHSRDSERKAYRHSREHHAAKGYGQIK